MEFELRSLVAVARTLAFPRAAQRLKLRQSVLSQRGCALAGEVGVSLQQSER